MKRLITAAAMLAATVATAHADKERLARAYGAYAHLKWCHSIREGYAVKFINDVELERGTAAIKVIVDEEKKANPAIDTDAAWEQGLKMIERYVHPRNANYPGQRDVCQHTLQQLLSAQPARIEKP